MYKADGTPKSFKEIVSECLEFKKTALLKRKQFKAYILKNPGTFTLKEFVNLQEMDKKTHRQIRILKALEATL